MAGPGLALELSDEEPEPEPEPRPRARAVSRGAATGRAMPTSRGSGSGWTTPWTTDSHSHSLLRKSFQLFDKDGDDAISAVELKSVLCNLGEDVDDRLADEMIAHGDPEATGEVSFEAFAALMTEQPLTLLGTAKSSREREGKKSQIRQLFDQIDQDGSGYLDQDEVMDLIRELGGSIKKRHLSTVMIQINPERPKPAGGWCGAQGEKDPGVSFEMFRGWWGERNRKLNDLLVLPEGMIFSIREDAKARKKLPSGRTPEIMWRRLAVLLRLLAERQTLWGDPRALYGQSDEEGDELSSPTTQLKEKLDALAQEKRTAAKLRRCFLRPDSKLRQAWDGSQVILLLYVLMTVPYRACFQLPTPALWTSEFWVELVVDVYFIIDIALNFRTAYYDSASGDLEIDQRKVCMNYLTHWFLIDSVSCLPITYIELISAEIDSGGGSLSSDDDGGTGSTFKAFKILRLLRLFKMLRIFRLKAIYLRYREFLDPLLSGMKVFSLTIIIFLCAHVAACLWYLVGTLSEEQESPHGTVVRSGWIHHEEMFQTHQCGLICGVPSDDDYNASCVAECYNIEDIDTYSAYIASLYWAITTVSTVGYGDIIAWTEIERLFSFFTTLFGVMVFGMISGTLSSILMTQKGAVQVYNQKMDEIRLFLKVKAVPTVMRRKVIAFYEHLWEESAVVDETEIMKAIPGSLNDEMTNYLYKDMIESVVLFHSMDAEVIRQICTHLRHTVVMQDQFVFFEGQLGKKMYIVESGELAVIRKNKEKCAPTCATPSQNPRCKHCIRLGRQGAKSFFGELAVMGAGTWQRRRRSIKAIENCKLSSLSKDSLDSLRRDYPQLNHQMFQVAQKIVCEGIGNITNIELENEPASKLDIDKLNRKVEGLEAKMDRLLTHLSVPEGKAEQREAQLLARSESAEMYTPGGSFDLAKATTEVAPEEETGALDGEPRARGGAGSAGKKVRRVLSVRAATSSRRVAAAQSAPGPSPDRASGGDRASRDSSSSLGSSSERRSSRTVLSASGLTEIEPTTPRGSPGPGALRGP